MSKLKYRLVPIGAADGRITVNIIVIDKADIVTQNLDYRTACDIVARDFNGPAAIDIVDMNAITVTSDGIVVDYAFPAFASCDYGKIGDFGFIEVSEMPYTKTLLEEEPHMRQWDVLHSGKRLYRGPTLKDKFPRTLNDEPQTITGRMANNNTGSEMMNVVEMQEVLFLAHGVIEIMRDGVVMIGDAGPEISVGIGMIVFETHGRIFHRAYHAGESGHNSGEYAKTVKSDYPAIGGRKSTIAQYTLNAIDIGMIPARHIGCSPLVLAVAKAYGAEIDIDNISDRAWIELNSVGCTRQWLETPADTFTREEIIANADKIIPGFEHAKPYKVSDVVEFRYAEI